MHSDDSAFLLLAIGILLASAKACGSLVRRLKQPAVGGSQVGSTVEALAAFGIINAFVLWFVIACYLIVNDAVPKAAAAKNPAAGSANQASTTPAAAPAAPATA